MTTSARMDEDQGQMTKRMLDLTLEIIHLLTGEDYEVVSKTGKQLTPCTRPHGSSLITEPQIHSLISEIHKKKIILAITNKMIELLTEEVPIRCQDVSVYLSMEEWEYLEGHKDLYKDLIMEHHQNLGFLKHDVQLNEQMWRLSLEIIYLLIGEDCAVVVKKSINHNLTMGSLDLFTRLRPINILSPFHLRHKMLNIQKFLDVTNKMTKLLAGEVPIRCQDVSVYFSMEEWEYLEGHKDLYKDLIMDDHQTLLSPDGSRNPPQRCPLDSTQEPPTFPHHHQTGNLGDYNIIIKEEFKREDDGYGVMEELSEGHKNLMEPPKTRNPPQRRPRSLYSRSSTQEPPTIAHLQNEQRMDMNVVVKKEEVEAYVLGDQQEEFGMMRTTKEEELSLHTRTDGSRDRPQRCPRPLDSTQEPQEVPQEIPYHDQSEEMFYMKVEVKQEEEEEPYVRDDQPSVVTVKPVEPSLAISAEMASVGGKRKRKSYDAGFKLKVVQRAEESSISIASKEFGVDEKQVRDWRRTKAVLEQIPNSKKACRGLTTPHVALESKLYNWILECRQSGYCVTRMEIRLRALQMAKDDQSKPQGIEKFAASAGWCTRFLNRFGLLHGKERFRRGSHKNLKKR